MEDQLQKLRRWASHGTMRQFYTELDARLVGEGYEMELAGDTVTVYKVHREGGFLGIGRRRVREPVLRVVRQEDGVDIPKEYADPDFVEMITTRLQAH